MKLNLQTCMPLKVVKPNSHMRDGDEATEKSASEEGEAERRNLDQRDCIMPPFCILVVWLALSSEQVT